MDVKDEIMRRVEALPPDAQRELLAQLNGRGEFPIKGESPESLLAFAGTLDDESAAEMIAAIEAEFETVDDGER
jgi:hypothetical protein